MFNQGQMERIANKLGYQGPMHKFNEFLASNPGAQRSFAGLEQKAKMMKMNRGGAVRKFQAGGFNPQAYLAANPDVAAAGMDPLEHYNKYGKFEGRTPTGAAPNPANVFNEQAYLQSNPDVAAAVQQGVYRTGLDHFIQYGSGEGRAPTGSATAKPASGGGSNITPMPSPPPGSPLNNPSPFNEQAYLAANPDVAAAVQQGIYPNAMAHYEQYGRFEGRNPSGGAPNPSQQFNEQAYLAANPDVAEAVQQGVYRTALDHFIQYGSSEGRDPTGGTAGAGAGAGSGTTTTAPSTGGGSGTGGAGASGQYYFMPGQQGQVVSGGQTFNDQIMQTAEGVGQPITGQSVPYQVPYGPMLDESGNPIQRQVLDIEGNPVLDASGNAVYETVYPTIADYSATQMYQPGLPMGAQQLAQGIEYGTQQGIATGTGEVGTAPTAAQPATATTAQATTPVTPTAEQYQAMLVAGQVPATAPAIGTASAPMQAQTTVPTSTEVANQQAAQLDSSVRIQAPDARKLSPEELVSAPADAQFAAQFAEEVEAATAQPSEEATVRGQLANMMAEFEDGQTPPWAAGAMRNATAMLAQRGLGASSLAGQAIIQAAMEAATPIAMQDAQTFAQFESQNLSNRQARAMLAAQQRAQFIGQEFDQEFQARVTNAARISDIANINFNAEQQIALENARMAQTVDLNNLNNRQAAQMANIAQISQLELTNLNNRQQAAVQNAQSFLQMDMANLSNDQQAVMFDAQSKVQALLSDQAAENAALQFNASSQNQVDQFFANLSSQVSQFNATQNNAMEQFNIEQESTINRFNSELQNQRDQFNAQNQLVIAQSNAQWRREIATINTAAINEANASNAQAVLGISEQAYANLWQAYEDEMEYAWQGGQNELDRINKLAQQRILADSSLAAADATRDAANSSALGSFVASALFGVPGASGFTGFLS